MHELHACLHRILCCSTRECSKGYKGSFFYVGSNQGGRKLRWGSVVNKTFRALRLVLFFGLTNNTRRKTTNLGKRIVTELALMWVLYFVVFTDEYFGNTDTSHLIYA